MKKALLLVLAALVIPSVALAKPSHGPKPAPMVTYKLKGILSNYAPYDSVTPANGSITIEVKHANHHGKALKGMTLSFPVDANTMTKLKHGLTTITNGDKGSVKIRAPRNIAPADLATQLQTYPASKINDKGAPKPKP